MKLMLITSILATLTIVMCDDDYEDDWKDCLKEERVPALEVRAFYDGGMLGPASNNVMCHMKCMLKELNILKHGVFVSAAAMRYFKRIPALNSYENIERIVNNCSNERGTTLCETAYKIVMCLMDAKVA